MENDAINIQGLTRDFDGKRALHSLMLHIPAGVVFGFLGPNGAGKTTTIRLLLGLLPPTAGNARVLGFDLVREANRIREHVGVVLEHPGLYERLTAYENLDYFGQIYHLPDQERKSRIHELLTRLDLWERRNQRVATFSRGMCQKLALARALLHRPLLLFLDEPTSGLDVPTALALRHELRHLAQANGTTIFLTTHNLAEAETVCDLVGIIHQGHLVACGSPVEISAQMSGSQVVVSGFGLTTEILAEIRRLSYVQYVTASSNEHLVVSLKAVEHTGRLVAFLVHTGVDIREVRPTRVSLEQVFLALTAEANNEQKAEVRIWQT